MNGCTAETEGCERWAPNLYLFTSKSATPGKGRRQENRRICLERKNGVLDSYSFQIISQEAGMGGWQ